MNNPSSSIFYHTPMTSSISSATIPMTDTHAPISTTSSARSKFGSIVQKVMDSDKPAFQPSGDWRIILNIGGHRFETFLFTIMQHKETRLAKELLYMNLLAREVFFDRDPMCFHMVLNYYRTGVLHAPLNMCGPMYEEELKFWEVDWNIVQPCCRGQLVVHHQVQSLVRSITAGSDGIDQQEKEWNLEAEKKQYNQTVGGPRLVRILAFMKLETKKIWNLLENPSTETVRGKIVSMVSVSMVIAAIIIMIVEYTPIGRECKVKSPNCTAFELNYGPVEHFLEQTATVEILNTCQIFEITYFTMELTFRFLFSPCKTYFLSEFINWIDFLAVVSLAVARIVEWAQKNTLPNAILVFCKVPRIFRLFKLATHMKELQVLMMSLKASFKELKLLLIIVMMFSLFWGVLGYSLELILEDVTYYGCFSHLRNLIKAYWWALVTMTTVGYGDILVLTTGGYIIGALCSLCGVLVIALPIPIVVNNFNLLYAHHQAIIEEKGAKGRYGMDSRKSSTKPEREEVGDSLLNTVTNQQETVV